MNEDISNYEKIKELLKTENGTYYNTCLEYHTKAKNVIADTLKKIKQEVNLNWGKEWGRSLQYSLGTTVNSDRKLTAITNSSGWRDVTSVVTGLKFGFYVHGRSTAVSIPYEWFWKYLTDEHVDMITSKTKKKTAGEFIHIRNNLTEGLKKLVKSPGLTGKEPYRREDIDIADAAVMETDNVQYGSGDKHMLITKKYGVQLIYATLSDRTELLTHNTISNYTYNSWDLRKIPPQANVGPRIGIVIFTEKKNMPVICGEFLMKGDKFTTPIAIDPFKADTGALRRNDTGILLDYEKVLNHESIQSIISDYINPWITATEELEELKKKYASTILLNTAGQW